MAVAHAVGFAAGNGIGILLERKIALGTVVVRLNSICDGRRIVRALRDRGLKVTTFKGQGAGGPVVLVHVAGPRRVVPTILGTARAVDPDVFYVIEPAHETSKGMPVRIRQVANPTGWRTVAKKKY